MTDLVSCNIAKTIGDIMPHEGENSFYCLKYKHINVALDTEKFMLLYND